MPPKAKTVEQEMIESAPIVNGPADAPEATDTAEAAQAAQAWQDYLATLDPFVQEQVNLADALEVQYRSCLEQRESNREILRHLAKQGKVDRSTVDSFYPPKVATKPRRRKGESDEDYAARMAAESNGNGS